MLKSGVLILTLKFPSPKKSPREAAVLAAGWTGRGGGAGASVWDPGAQSYQRAGLPLRVQETLSEARERPAARLPDRH